MQVPAINSELPGGVPFDLAAPVQGHYGAMRNAGAEGSTYLHTQLMQVLLLPPLCKCMYKRRACRPWLGCSYCTSTDLTLLGMDCHWGLQWLSRGLGRTEQS